MAYYLGYAVRRTVDAVLFPYRAIRTKSRRRRRSRRPYRTSLSRRAEIASRLSSMEGRLHSLERILFSSEHPLDEGAAQEAGEVSAELFEALADPDPGVRRLAMSTIQDLVTGRATSLIVQALHDPDPSVRCAAAAAAAGTGAAATVFTLILSLEDSAMEVRHAAKFAIERITGCEIELDFSEDASTRRRMIENLRGWWKEERFARLAAEVEAVFEP
ncbi:MAG: HEAT repeat domain-containing protein [Deltaproteobacteria bacterium]|nr:HEAT repeat domain-containing protein [Deltaproteobacteria bacterium]